MAVDRWITVDRTEVHAMMASDLIAGERIFVPLNAEKDSMGLRNMHGLQKSRRLEICVGMAFSNPNDRRWFRSPDGREWLGSPGG